MKQILEILNLHVFTEIPKRRVDQVTGRGSVFIRFMPLRWCIPPLLFTHGIDYIPCMFSESQVASNPHL